MTDTNEPIAPQQRIEQIIEFAAQGLTDKEIAHELGISKHTVDTYWQRLKSKTGAKSRTATVIDFLRDRIEQQNRQLQEANDALQKVYDANRTGMASLLLDVQRRLVESERNAQHSRYFDQASRIAHAVVYELESINPVLYRYLSPSTELFGIETSSLRKTEASFYEMIFPEDLPHLYEKSLGAPYGKNDRHYFIYRIQMPEPRWVMDIHQAVYNEDSTFRGVVGLATDIHELVLAGVIPPVVTRISGFAEPAPVLSESASQISRP